MAVGEAGNTATIKNVLKNNNKILHETCHLAGLSDRYDETDNNLRFRHVASSSGFERVGSSEGTYKLVNGVWTRQ